jgi:hypothetical protein
MEILKRMFVSILVVTFALSMAPLAALADVGQPADVNKGLMDKIDQLENRIKQLETRPSGEVKAVPVYAPPTEGGVLRAMEDLNVSGYVETSFNLNTHKPTYGGLNAFNNRSGVNDLRSFDQYEDTFVLNGIKLTVEKPVAETGGIGGRIDLMFGEDAKFLNAATKRAQYSNQLQTVDANGNFITSNGTWAYINDVDNTFIEQAYGLLRAPYGNGIDIYFGKFVTLLGVEVIENKDNWNASRGLIFNYGKPFTNTGLRASYDWNDKFNTIIGVNNGGDQDLDNNNEKSMEAKATYKFNDKITLSQAANVGLGGETPTRNENASTQKSPFFLWSDDNQHSGGTLLILDTIIGVQMTDKWATKFESLWGQNGFGQWYTVGVWNRYEYNDWIAFNHRFEWFNDTSNARMGIIGVTSWDGVSSAADYTDDGYDAWEMTFGLDLTVYKNLLTRMEYRFDSAPGTDRVQNEADFQSTFLASLIYSF